MAYIESSYKQLLFGVSQQDYKDRLDGQNEEQVNMVSDLTFNLRRRAPVRFVAFTDIGGAPDRLAHFDTTISNNRIALVADTVAGSLRVLSTSGSVLATLSNSYLEASEGRAIRFATLGDEVYVANIEAAPSVEVSPDRLGLPEPARHGYFYITSGQYGKTYRLTVLNRDTGISHTVSYTTPDGSQASHADETTPEYIAQELVDAAEAHASIGTAAGVSYVSEGAYAYLESTSFDITVSSDSGSNFIRASLAGTIREVGDLPARLPDIADGFIVGVGTTRTATFYRWTNERQAWLEDAAWDAFDVPTDMPLRLRVVDGTWTLTAPDWERRASGDSETNPTLKALKQGITGMGSFQGRLVLLSNDYVCMSASNNPLRFFRSTVASLQNDDPIEVASTASQAAPYQWVSSFNKDLVVWADKYQSVVPGGQAVTPSNASISITSQYEAQLRAEPITTGRSMFFAVARSDGFSGVWEAVPSEYTDSQLMGADVTNHLPRYTPGAVRFLAGSATSNVLVAGYTGNRRELLVHEFLWSGGEKQHHAWHKWEFGWDVQHAWFVGDQLHMLVWVEDELVYSILDLRIGAGDTSATTGRLDLFHSVTANAQSEVTVDSRLVDAWGDVWAFKTSGEHPYMKQLLTETSREDGVSTLSVPAAVDGDTYILGRRYRSSLVPTAPSIRDRNGVPITTQRALLHKWVVTLQNTGEFTFTISDKYREAATTLTSPLTFGSPELSVGLPQVAGGQQYIPARLDMPTSRLELATDDVYDLNITSLEYGFRYHQRYGRRM